LIHNFCLRKEQDNWFFWGRQVQKSKIPRSITVKKIKR
jgi:hypothetical protein